MYMYKAKKKQSIIKPSNWNYYIARIYEEVKGRPRYIIGEEVGYDKADV